MRILIIAQPRTGGTVFSNWLSKELEIDWINEPFLHNKEDDIEKIFNSDNIVVKLIFEQNTGEWSHNRKIQNIFHLFSLNWNNIFILTRENIFEQATSTIWAKTNYKWHTNYQIDQNWINQHMNLIEDFFEKIKEGREYLRNLRQTQITYEEIFYEKTDLYRICSYVGINETKFIEDLSIGKKYRGGQTVKNTRII
jgi:hypothetical protein